MIRRHGARARTKGRPRQLVRIPLGGSEGFVSNLTTEQTDGMCIAMEDHLLLGHLVPRSSLHSPHTANRVHQYYIIYSKNTFLIMGVGHMSWISYPHSQP